MAAEKKRNGKIEFLRFVFAAVIVIFHSETIMVNKKAVIMFSGRMACEFFFLVSGYLMAATAQKLLTQGSKLNIGRETEKFIWRKYCSLYPAVIVGDIAFLVVHCSIYGYSLMKTARTFISSTPCFFLFHYTGIHTTRINETWFLSVMIISMAVLFPLLLRHHGIMRRVGSLLIGSMILGYLMITTGDLRNPDGLIANLIYKGTLRGFAEICLGIFAYEMCQELRNIKFTKPGRWLVTFAEAALYCAIFAYMLFHRASKFDYYVVYLLLAAVAVSFSDVSFGGAFFNRKIFCFLGKSSLYIYLSHTAAKKCIGHIASDSWENPLRMASYLALTVVFTAVVWGTSVLVRRAFLSLKKQFISA